MKEPGNHRQGQVSHLPISVASISSQPVAGEQEKAVKLRLRGLAVWGTMTKRTGHSRGPKSLLSAGKETRAGIDQTSA